jgi:hypothetical protein
MLISTSPYLLALRNDGIGIRARRGEVSRNCLSGNERRGFGLSRHMTGGVRGGSRGGRTGWRKGKRGLRQIVSGIRGMAFRIRGLRKDCWSCCLVAYGGFGVRGIPS